MITEKNKKYPITQSIFYKLSNKRRLYKILFTSQSVIQEIINNNDKFYQKYIIEKKGKNDRTIQAPIDVLKKIHERIGGLLQQIEEPEYLLSGVKDKSNIQNVLAHKSNCLKQICKLDLKKFFPSIKEHYIHHFWSKKMKVSPDIAYILTKICCCHGIYDKKTVQKNTEAKIQADNDWILPTGSPLSTIISYYSCSHIFTKIAELAKQNDCIFTLYVDDLTFSGEKSRQVRFEASKIIKNYGFTAHKAKSYSKNKPAIITGIVVTNKGELRLQNKLCKEIRQGKKSKENPKRIKGQLVYGKQVDKHNKIQSRDTI